MDQSAVLIIHEDAAVRALLGRMLPSFGYAVRAVDVRRGGDRRGRPRGCQCGPARPRPFRHVGRGHAAGDSRHVSRTGSRRHLRPRHGDRGRGGGPARRVRLRPPAVRLQGPQRDPARGPRAGRPAAPELAPRGGAQGPRPVSRDRRPEPWDQARPRPGQQGRADALPGAHPGRERDGQGAGGPGPPCQQPAGCHAPDDRRLRRAPGHPPRERALRPRARAPSRVRTGSSTGSSRRRTRAPCSWTRSAR